MGHITTTLVAPCTQEFNSRAKTAKATRVSGDALEEGAAADGDAPSDEQAKKSDQDDGAEAKKKKKKKKKDEDGASGAEDGEKKARSLARARCE